jgi:hypothetical protein
MSRHDYQGVSPETEAAVKPCVGAIAYEMQVSDKYLYAIIAGEKTDPFEPFLLLFRAVARKNPDGARGYVARLNTVLNEECPPKEVSRGLDVALTFSDLMAVSAEREEGLCTEEKLETAKQRHVEAVARFGMRERSGIEMPS